ncbi:hypothetical protein ABZ918_30805 [Streptomyces viridosporus]|uniref:hypothetical protein n=1 Tax=Streptomyces viridosporus TaxID=67581 RepID=UPI0034302D08
MAIYEQQTGADQVQQEDHGASVRGAARWLVTSYAALAALLVAGIQLKDVSSITSEWRLAVALLAVLIALLATSTVIVAASRVLIAPALTWNDLVRRETKEMTGRPTTPAAILDETPPKQDPLLTELKWFTQIQPVQFTSPRDLREKLSAAREDLSNNPSDGLREQVLQYEQAAQACLQQANAWWSRQLYERLITLLKWSSTVIAVCILVFLWASRPPEEPAKVSKPFPVTVYLQGSTAAITAAKLDAACVRQVLSGWAVDGKINEPEVVTQPRGACPASRFTVSDELGVAVPAAAK